nr:uncharacterized protein LOC129280013 [Lytechinus pictus]
MKSKLSVHIKEQHGEEERVKIALLLPKSERDAAFQGFKKEGILKQNKEEVKKANPKYSRERSSNHKHAGELVMCSICEGFYSKVYIKRHQDQCMKQSQSSNCDTKPIRLNMFERFTDKEDTRFVMNVLGKFRDDAVGKMCTTDPVLMEIGKKLWSKEKRKVDRKAEVRRGVMRDMRRIGTFYQEMLNSEEKLGPLKVKKGDVSDIFHCRNFKQLEEAVETMTLKEDQSGIKAGLKHCLYYLLKTASRIVKVLYILDNDDEAAIGVDKFVSLFEMNHNFIFGNASYQINNARESKLRRPAERPLENDMSILRDYILNRTEELLRDEYEFMNLHQYIELRNLTLCRLTLFNARRGGGEPAQLVTKHWEDAESGAWLDQQNMGQLNPLDAAIASTLKIAFQTGKRNALVPILFPKDTVEPLKVLSSEEVRSSVGISSENKFLFPSTTSDDHVSGWHVLDSICRKLNLGKMVKEDRPYIYRHLGHSEEINRDVYQDPLAVKELTVVGKRLLQIDETCATSLVSSSMSAGETPTDATEASMSAEETTTHTTESSVSAGETPTDTTVSISDEEEASVSSNTLGETPADTTVSRVATSSQFPKVRKYTTWGDEKTIVDNYFASYIEQNEQKRLPGKKEVMKFLSLHPDFPHDHKVIHARVMNRVYASEKMAKDRLKKMNTY